MQIVSGLFETYQEANAAVENLLDQGYSQQNISILGREDVLVTSEDNSNTAASAGKGAGIGSIIGLIAGAMSFAIPGVGAVIGTGTIISGTLTGAGIGAATGGIVGIFQDWFGNQGYETKVKDALNQGHILLAVEAGDNTADNARQVLSDNGAYDIEEHTVEPSNARA